MSARPHWPDGTPPLPEARVVKEGTRRVAQPTFREGMRGFVTPSDRTRDTVAVIAALWPLILLVGVGVALLWTAGYHSVQP